MNSKKQTEKSCSASVNMCSRCRRDLRCLTTKIVDEQISDAVGRPRDGRSIELKTTLKWRVEVKKRVPYSAPRLTAHGSVEKITKGLSVGQNIDAAFPRGTPVDVLTFT